MEIPGYYENYDEWNRQVKPHYARFKESRLARFLCRLRPLHNWRTGGDATLGWGVKDLPC
jgi:hypothetical protein